MASQAWKNAHQEEMRAYRRKHYRKNASTYKQNVYRRRSELKDWYRELKESLKCNRCLESYWAALDFHHPNPDKDIEVSRAIHDGWSKTRIEAEMKKCEVLCANCHRKEHHPEDET